MEINSVATFGLVLLGFVGMWIMFNNKIKEVASKQSVQIFNTDTKEYADITSMESRIEAKFVGMMSQMEERYEGKITVLTNEITGLRSTVVELTNEVNDLKRKDMVNNTLIGGLERTIKRSFRFNN
jgi:phage host-nuclease inhibitor protein Gam